VLSRSGLCFLLESVQHDHCIGHPGGVDDPVGARVVPDPEFFDALADRGHGLEVVGLLATLHLVELIAGILLRIRWKFLQAFEGVAQKADRLHEYIQMDIDRSSVS
jgi:hypothetical protein